MLDGKARSARNVAATIISHFGKELPMKCYLVAMGFFLAQSVFGQSPTATLGATPSTVVWGYYSAKAKPVLSVHSGDSVRIQTLSTCGSTERLIGEGVSAADIPAYNGDIYREVKDKGPGG